MNRIGSDISQSIARRSLNQATAQRSLVMQRLATGQRINTARDDPAGLIASENLRSILEAIDAESRSLQRASHVISTADGALGTVSDLLIEAEGLAVANANSTGMSDAERQANQMQLDSIIATVNRIGVSTSFNGDALLDGSATIAAAGETVEVDSINAGTIGEIEIDGNSYTLASAGAGGVLNIVNGDVAGAQQAIRAARQQISVQRGALGAFDRFSINTRLSNLRTTFEHTAAAESTIRDADYAREASNLNRMDVLVAAAGVSLSLVNRGPRHLIDLLA